MFCSARNIYLTKQGTSVSVGYKMDKLIRLNKRGMVSNELLENCSGEEPTIVGTILFNFPALIYTHRKNGGYIEIWTPNRLINYLLHNFFTNQLNSLLLKTIILFYTKELDINHFNSCTLCESCMLKDSCVRNMERSTICFQYVPVAIVCQEFKSKLDEVL